MFLVVVTPFGAHSRGDAITDADEIAAVLAEHSEKVVRVGADAAPAVSPVAAPPATAIEEK